MVKQTGCGPYAYIVLFLTAVWEGVREGLDGVAASVLLTDGGFHEADSRDAGYREAGLYAGRAALAGAGLGPPVEGRGRQIAVHYPGKPRPKPKPRPRS